MKMLIKLILINFLGTFNLKKLSFSNFKANFKSKIFKIILFLYIMISINLSVFFLANFVLKGLSILSAEHVLLVIVMAIASLNSVLFTIVKVNKTLFDAKDYSILLSLPIKRSTIIASKVGILYLTNLIYFLFLILPTYIAYILKVNTNILFSVLFFITFFIIPIIPTVIGAVIGSIVTAIMSRFKYKNFVNIILSFCLVLGMIYITNLSSGMDSLQLANLSVSIVNKLNRIYPLSGLYLNIINNHSLVSLLIFVIISFGIFKLFIIILVKYFDNINSRLKSVTIHNLYQAKKVKTKSTLLSLYYKELKKYFSSSLYVLNTAMGCVMLIVALISLLFLGEEKLDSFLQIPGLSNTIIIYGPLVFSVFCSLSCTTNSSISLEGKSIWQLKCLPLKISHIFWAKIFVNLTILIPTILIGTIILGIAFKLSIISIILLLIIPLIFSVFISGFGLLMNLYFPNLNWTNEIRVIKQSTPVLITIGVGLLLSTVPVLLIFEMDNNLYMSIVGFIMFIALLILYSILFKKGPKLFKNLI